MAEAIVQVLKVKNIPLYRAEEFGDNLSEEKLECLTGSTNYSAKIKTEYDKEWDETFEEVVKADVSFNDCRAKVGYSNEYKVYNGELHYNRNETKTSSTDTYQFKDLSVQASESLSGNNTYTYAGEYVQKYELNKQGDIDATQSWNFAITYADPSEELNFTTKGKQSYTADFEEDETLSPVLYQSSFVFNDKAYQLTYEDNKPYGYDIDYSDVKFYVSELGYFNLNLNGINGASCLKDSKSYAGLSGEIKITDNSGANLLVIMPSCDGVTFQ